MACLKRQLAAQVLLIFFSMVNAYGQDTVEEPAKGTTDDLDAIFDDVQDTVALPADSPLAKLEEKHGLKFSGTAEAKAGTYAGWLDLPASGEALDSGLDVSAGVDFDLDLDFSAVVDPTFSIHGTLAFDIGIMSEDSDLSLDFNASRVFIDYVLMDAVFVRVGHFETEWGLGTFYNHGDLVPDADLSLQLVIPIDPFCFTMVFQGDESYFPEGISDSAALAKLDYAGKIELRFPAAVIHLAGRYQQIDPVMFSAGAAFSLLGMDLKSEFRLDGPEAGEETWDWTADASIFYEIPDPRIQLFAEYAYNSNNDTSLSWVNDHRSILGVRFPQLSGGVQVACTWAQAWTDWSGLVLGLVTIPLWDHLKLVTGILGRFGEDGTIYRTLDLPDQDLPGHQLALILGLTLQADFRDL